MPKFGYPFTCPHGHKEIQAIDADQFRTSLERPFGRRRICLECGEVFEPPNDYWHQGRQWLKEQEDAAEDSN